MENWKCTVEKMVKSDKKQPKITFYTRAYNAEKYIEQTILSVLNQSLKEIEYLIVDNASTDRTFEICEKYATIDSRIILLKNEYNTVINPEYKTKWYEPKGEYFSYLDSDDFIYSTFAEKLYTAAKKNDADIAVGGTIGFYEDDPNKGFIRIPPKYEIKNMKEFESIFSKIYGSIRPLWGKIYKTSFRNSYLGYVIDTPKYFSSGVDTLMVLRYLKKCKSIVFVDEKLCAYRIRDDSNFSTDLNLQCINQAKFLLKEGLELLNIWEINNEKNQLFLKEVYVQSLMDNYRSAFRNAAMNPKNAILIIHEILEDALFNEMISLKDKKNLEKATIEGMHIFHQFAEINNMTPDHLDRYYFLSAYRLINERDNYRLSDFILLFFKLTLNIKNHYNYGKFYLAENLKQVNTINNESLSERILDEPYITIDVLKSVLNSDSVMEAKKIEECKDRGIKLFEQGKYGEALFEFNEIRLIKILDSETLYFIILIAWEMGDYDYSRDLVDILIFYHPNYAFGFALAGDIYAALNQLERARVYYNNAINLTDDVQFIEDIRQRI